MRIRKGPSGMKHHLLVGAIGLLLPFSLAGGNRNDVT